ncbi:Bug family tripartite tricarboxylate transporter substrate binding protein [Klebsiella oxytoca]
MNISFLRHFSAIALCLCTASAYATEAPSRTECIAPAKPGGGFDLTCKLLQVSLMETGAIKKPMRVTYMPGGVGAVAYNAIVAQRPGEPGTVVAFSGGSLLNLSQGKFGRYGVDDVRWLASVGTDYGMIAVRTDSPWKDLASFMAAMEKNPASIVIGAGASIGSQDWMKAALLAQKANVPTAKEQGYDLVWPIIRGFFVGPKVSDVDYQWWVEEFSKLQQTDAFKKQRELRGLFEFNVNGKELDAYVKKQVEDYRQQAKAFGLAK